jgi:hypothetical protein
VSQADFSEYVVHFTKDGDPYSAQQHPDEVNGITGTDARRRLSRILQMRRITATRMPWTNRRAICFTECTWPSLLRHCATYSSYGIGFQKPKIFERAGGPAIYMRQDHYRAQRAAHEFVNEIFPFITPFAPPYAPAPHLEEFWKDKPPIDYTYEREWRLPSDMQFAFDDIAFIFLDTHADVAAMPDAVRAALPADKWIIVSNYRKIEELWPQHIVL